MLFFIKQKTAYEMRISDGSSDVCSSDLRTDRRDFRRRCVLRAVQGARRPELVRRVVGRVGPTNPAPPSLTPQGAGLMKPTQPTDLDFPPCRQASGAQQHLAAAARLQRSEERRVGKEWVSKWRTWWSA